jgi:hypothetical protein
MDNMDSEQEALATPDILVCDLGSIDWLQLTDGTVLVDYKYIMELAKKCGG